MDGEQRALGETRAKISKEIVRLQSEYYGKGPTKAKTYIVDDLVVVVLEESFTRAEKTLVERGEREAIQHIRRRFQQDGGQLYERRRAGDRTQGQDVFVGDRHRAGRLGRDVSARRRAHGHDGLRGRLSERLTGSRKRPGRAPWAVVRTRRPRRRGRDRSDY